MFTILLQITAQTTVIALTSRRSEERLSTLEDLPPQACDHSDRHCVVSLASRTSGNSLSTEADTYVVVNVFEHQ